MNKITLLDGVEWDIKELEAKMVSDEFYYGYCGQSMLSSSMAKSLVDSPKTYHNYLNYGGGDTPALLEGQDAASHGVGTDRFNDIYEIVEVKTRAAALFKETQANTERKCVTIKEYRDTERLAEALTKNKMVMAHLSELSLKYPKRES